MQQQQPLTDTPEQQQQQMGTHMLEQTGFGGAHMTEALSWLMPTTQVAQGQSGGHFSAPSPSQQMPLTRFLRQATSEGAEMGASLNVWVSQLLSCTLVAASEAGKGVQGSEAAGTGEQALREGGEAVPLVQKQKLGVPLEQAMTHSPGVRVQGSA